MRIVVCGLSITSSWGNGHATTYRALLRALAARGHEILFLERDLPWYRDNRDLPEPGFCATALYSSLDELRAFAGEVRRADLVIVGSYVPEGIAVGRFVQEQALGLTAFYDIDTPVTLEALREGRCDYLEPGQIEAYDLYLSFTGGPTLRHLEGTYRSPMARALYCSVDPELYAPLDAPARWDLGYLGTYSDDRQPTLDRLLVEPARRSELRFIVAGAQYPSMAWPANVEREVHLSPREHRAFYAAQRFTLNVTRAAMVRCGHSPSVRLFEAAACGVPVISDEWPGLGELFVQGREILVARTTADVLTILRETSDEDRRRIGAAARSRVLFRHTAECRALELEGVVRERREQLSKPRRGEASCVFAPSGQDTSDW